MAKRKSAYETCYPETAFGGFSDVDGTVTFYTRVNALLQPSFTVLDIGCGRGSHAEDSTVFRRNLRTLKGKCKQVIGIDVDETSRVNPFLDEFRLIEGRQWPVDDASVDLCVSDNVLEHIASPDDFFSECARVLRTAGVLCLRTPSTLHYGALLARLIPNRFHPWITAKVQSHRKEVDVFPTLYKCNTVRKIRTMIHRHGFESCVYNHEAEPAYLSFSSVAYRLGVLYGRACPRILSANIFGFARKKAA